MGDWPEHLTEPGGRFFEATNDLDNFLGFTRQLAERHDQIMEISRQALLKGSGLTPAQRRELEERPDRAAQTALDQWADLLLEMEYSRIVDNYLAYVAELLAVVFRTRPETMRSEKQVSLRFALEHNSMDDLIDALAEQEVERFSRAGLRQLHDELTRSMGFALFVVDDAFDGAARAVEIRNLIVHKRGVVGRRFLSRLPDEPAEIGTRFTPTEYDAAFAASLFTYAVRDTDVRAAEKWDLSRPLDTSDYLDLSGE